MRELRFFQLEAFVTTADKGSFSSAARALGKAQSAVSTAVMNLEIDLGVTLFDRKGKFPILTEQGTSLLREAREILALGRNMQLKAEGFCQQEEASLTIALEECMPFEIVQSCLHQFAQRFPQVDIHIVTVSMREAEALVNDQQADLGFIVTFPPPAFHKNMMEICHFTAVPVASTDHPLASLEDLTHQDLYPYRQVLYHNKCGEKESDEQIVGGQVWYVDSCLVAKRLTLAGLGWSYLPDFMVEKPIREKRLAPLSIIGETNSVIPVIMAWNADAPLGPAARYLVDLFLHHPATSGPKPQP
ncbi:MAG: LysR family transcriptional regulator [Desulfobacterales bacterium]|nr:LysR family transcriptional regulator [Desulfobacterales bacterium]